MKSKQVLLMNMNIKINGYEIENLPKPADLNAGAAMEIIEPMYELIKTAKDRKEKKFYRNLLQPYLDQYNKNIKKKVWKQVKAKSKKTIKVAA